MIVTTQDRSLVTDNPCCMPVLLDSLTLMESIELLSLLVGKMPQDLARFVSEKLEFQPAFLVSAAKRVKLQSAKENKSVVDTWTEMLQIVQNRYKEDWPYYHAALNETTRSKLKSSMETVSKRSNSIEECFHLLLLAKGCHLPLDFVTRFISSDLSISEREVEHCLRDSPFIGVSSNDTVAISGMIYKLCYDVFAPAIRTERMIHRLRRLCKFCVLNTHDTVVAKVMKTMSPKLMQYLALLDLRFSAHEEQRSLYHELGKAYLCVLVDYSSAVRCFTKAISIFEESNDIAEPEYAQLLNRMGNVLRLTGNTDEAWKYLTKSLKLLKAISCDSDSEDVAGCLSSLGLVCLSQGKNWKRNCKYEGDLCPLTLIFEARLHYRKRHRHVVNVNFTGLLQLVNKLPILSSCNKYCKIRIITMNLQQFCRQLAADLSLKYFLYLKAILNSDSNLAWPCSNQTIEIVVCRYQIAMLMQRLKEFCLLSTEIFTIL